MTETTLEPTKTLKNAAEKIKGTPQESHIYIVTAGLFQK